jgi:hypothetical protein
MAEDTLGFTGEARGASLRAALRVARIAPVTLRLAGSDERQRTQTIELCPESGIDLCIALTDDQGRGLDVDALRPSWPRWWNVTQTSVLMSATRT